MFGEDHAVEPQQLGPSDRLLQVHAIVTERVRRVQVDVHHGEVRGHHQGHLRRGDVLTPEPEVQHSERRFRQRGSGHVSHAALRVELLPGVVVRADRKRHAALGVPAHDLVVVGQMVGVGASDGRVDGIVLEHQQRVRRVRGPDLAQQVHAGLAPCGEITRIVMICEGHDLMALDGAMPRRVAKDAEHALGRSVVVARHDDEGLVPPREFVAQFGQVVLRSHREAVVDQVAEQHDRVRVELAQGPPQRAAGQLQPQPGLAPFRGASVLGVVDVVDVGQHEQVQLGDMRGFG